MKKLPKINTAKLLKAALPYIFIGLMATKLGQAYRMVPEGDVLDKALGALLNIGTVFQNPLPSFHPFDLIVGAVCGVLIWFIVYQKSKNARKYRRGAEYGTARWGTAKDIEPFIDPDFSQNILLSDTERLTLGKIADPEKRNVNLNVLVIGGSGSGKTRYHIKPNLLQMNASYVCSDPKGTVIEEIGRAMVRGGYKIKVLNTIDFACSIFLIIRKTCQPFGSGKKCFGKTVDNHSSLRINAVSFIPLNGGLVHADTLAKFRHRKFEFYSTLFNALPDLF